METSPGERGASVTKGGTSFWKVFFAIVAALVVVAGCAAGACLMLLGRAAKTVTTTIAESEQARQGYREKVSVSLRELARVSPGSDLVQIRGTIKNNGDRTLNFWKVTVKFKDSTGNVIDTAVTAGGFVERIKPGESKNFEIMHRFDQRFRDTTAEVEEVRLE